MSWRHRLGSITLRIIEQTPNIVFTSQATSLSLGR
jgi:hypothetical protein